MKILITGGAGFIGANCSHVLASRGHSIVVIDNLSRPGAEANLDWLRSRHDLRVDLLDVRDADAMCGIFEEHEDADCVLHLAGQVAVTMSVEDPRGDFEANALGTLNVLEAVRQAGGNPLFIYSSTNKVYGGLSVLETEEEPSRYRYRDCDHGVREDTVLDFHSPYGCSKGAADQYVHDYSRIYGLRTVVCRQSCIYGYRQFGVEDQGWVAWFTIAAVLGLPITVYGDGKQVRDLLFVEDLVDCYERMVGNPSAVAGRIFNVGGGPSNTLSLLELIRWLEERAGPLNLRYDEWRPGDQRVFVTDVRELERSLGWRPETSVPEGLDRLYSWVSENKGLFTAFE